MFDKQKSDKQDPSFSSSYSNNSPSPSVSASAGAVVGSSITIKGDISGEENLVIAGKVTGNVTFGSHEVTISNGGSVNADVTANVVKIEGEVTGDLTGNEKVVITKTGKVQGNIVAPRVTLEDGAKFKGSIDMDPGTNSSVGLTAVKNTSATDSKSESEPAAKNG